MVIIIENHRFSKYIHGGSYICQVDYIQKEKETEQRKKQISVDQGKDLRKKLKVSKFFRGFVILYN